MTTDEIREALKDYRLTSVAKASGVNYTTLLRFFKGKRDTKSSTVDKLRAYLKGEGKE